VNGVIVNNAYGSAIPMTRIFLGDVIGKGDQLIIPKSGLIVDKVSKYD